MTKIIHSQRLAAYLMAQGFVLIRTEPDKRRNGKNGRPRNVFIFRASSGLESAISDYLYQR